MRSIFDANVNRVWNILLALAALCLAAHLSFNTTTVVAQVTDGIAAGWVVSDAGDEAEDIQPGDNSTQVLVGPGAFVPTISVSQTSPGGNAFGEAEFPDTRVVVDSRGLGVGALQEVAYAGAYFSDTITITGGVGEADVSISWDVDGNITGAGGSFGFGDVAPLNVPLAGSAAVNFRVFLEPFGQQAELQDLSETDFFEDFALAPSEENRNGLFGLNVPEYDPSFGEGVSLPGVGRFIFEETPLFDDSEFAEPIFIESWLTDSNADQLAFLGGGARFTWDFGVPFRIGVLLEGWATEGGVVDFGNTGSITDFTVPQGASLVSANGATYNVTQTIPEPGSIILLSLGGLITMSTQRRR